MRALLLGLVFVLAACSPPAQHQSSGPESIAAQARRLGFKHSIRIGYGSPETFYTAPYGPSDAAIGGLWAIAADPTSAAVALNGVERALEQYPGGFLAKLIRAIFICGELRVDGASVASTVGPEWIILAASKRVGVPGLFATGFLGIHHEVGSFVFHEDPETPQRWAAFAPEGWQALEDSTAIVAHADAAPPDPETGFLSAYGATHPEIDFAVYAEKLFSEPANLAKLAHAHPLIARKLAVVITAYTAIDRRMSAVFRKLGVAP